MKIISKFKDYYDFLQGKYGIDPLKVLDRTLSPQPYFAHGSKLVFCNTSYLLMAKLEYEKSLKYRLSCQDSKYEEVGYTKDSVWLKIKGEVNNEKHPIVLMKYKGSVAYNFCLKTIGFDKVLSPEDCYIQIETFLGKEDPVQTIPTDLDRFEAKGFSRKTSFRNM